MLTLNQTRLEKKTVHMSTLKNN